jgi:hypothetical protein
VTSDSSIDNRRRPHWGWILSFAFLALALITVAFEEAMHFRGPPLDGPFQLFNALRRIGAGQRIGETFQFFHGPAVPYLFYPTFALGGSSFFASEMSRQLISIILFLGLMLAAFRAWTGSWRQGLPLAVAATLISIEFWLNALTLPINSLLGVRSAMPIVVGIHLLLRPEGRRAEVERGVLLGLALLLGTEQGVASIGALAIVTFIAALRQKRWVGPAMAVVIPAITAIGVYLLVVLLLAGPRFVGSVLHFNFREVPQDQLWYFGAPPNPFLSKWSEFLPLLSVARWWIVLGAAVVIALRGLWRESRDADPRRAVAEAFLMVYGVISLASMLGTFVAVYAEPAVRVAIVVLLVWAYRNWPEWKTRIAARQPRVARYVPILALGLIIVAMIARRPRATLAMFRTPLHTAFAHVFGSQGATMDADWQQTDASGMRVIERTRQSIGRTPIIWSTYAGLLEWKTDVFHPYTDYIIHALGPERRAEYAARFIASRPDIVQTIRPSYTKYEEWLEGSHWNFYRPLLANYDLVAAGPWSLFWTPRGGPALPPGPVVLNTAVPPGQLAIAIPPSIPADSIGLYEVRVRYRIANRIGSIPVMGSMPRYLIDIGNTPNSYPISLAPYDSVRAFPVVASGRAPILLNGHVESLFGGASLRIDSIRVERIPLSAANTAWMADILAAAGRLAPRGTTR